MSKRIENVNVAAEFNVDAFVSDLSNATARRSGGKEKLYTLNMAKIQANAAEIMKLQLQARIVIKGLLLAKPDLPFTVSQMSEFAVTAGLETKQDPIKIVRFYMKQLKTLALEEFKI